MEELKKCPFCGGEAVWDFLNGYKTMGWSIVCIQCRSRCGYHATKEEATTAWNTRKPMERIVKKLGASSIMLATSKEYWENPQKGGNTMEVIPIQDAIKIVKEELN